MLLHSSNRSLCLFGQDIDPLVVAMCKINGALYAPWMSFPLPARILGTHVGVPRASRSSPESLFGIEPILKAAKQMTLFDEPTD
jgi:hypothetical protein